MKNNDLKLLDCTLRDGGYINDWKWGFQQARTIIRFLVRAHVDIVEVGFLRDVEKYDPNITVCNSIEELNQLIPKDASETIFSAMAMQSNYDIDKLSPYRGSGVEMIRITAHDYDIVEGMDFAQKVKDKGYKLSINPINIMGYSDERILWMIQRVNEIQPYQFSIVDTFGSMRRRDLDRIVSIVDHNLNQNIRLAIHLHDNMSLSYCLAQDFVNYHLNRPITVDASLMGIGRVPGNLPIELMVDFLNDYAGKNYDIDYIMDAIQDYIAPIKQTLGWGYVPAYFLSAKFNLHRNYSEYYLKKGDLTNRDINHILSRFDRKKATAFDEQYADKMYKEYNNNKYQDYTDRELLKKDICGKDILVVAPGATIIEYQTKIDQFITEKNPIVISVNFVPEIMKVDYAFFSNQRRLNQLSNKCCRLIFTSNLMDDKADYYIDYNSLTGAFDQGCNSLIMLLKLLCELSVNQVVVAGADGYTPDGKNYYSTHICNPNKPDHNFNMAVKKALHKLDMSIYFLTPSAYDVE